MIFQIKARCFSGIVFWEYDKKDTYDIIVSKNYNELIKEKACSFFVSFDKCLKYDKEVLEFYYSDEEIMNTKIQLRDYDIGNAYFFDQEKDLKKICTKKIDDYFLKE